MSDDLKWKVTEDRIQAELLPSIDVSIKFEDKGPDSAAWLRLSFSHPVGGGLTLVTAPTEPLAQYAENVAEGKTLEMINEIFERVLLAPRRKQFEETMAKLTQG